MGRIRFGLLEEPETRRPSKVRVTLMLLLIVLFVLSVTFIALYVVEENKSDESPSKQGQQNGTVNPTTSNTTEKPTHAPTTTPSNSTCNTPACIISASGILQICYVDIFTIIINWRCVPLRMTAHLRVAHQIVNNCVYHWDFLVLKARFRACRFVDCKFPCVFDVTCLPLVLIVAMWCGIKYAKMYAVAARRCAFK